MRRRDRLSGATFRLLLPHLVDHVTCHVIDFPSAGSSRFDANTNLTIEQHIETVRRVIDLLELDEVVVVDVPVQLVLGDQDPFFPVENAQAMVPQFLDAQLTVIEGVGPFSHEEAPAEVAQALLPTLIGTR